MVYVSVLWYAVVAVGHQTRCLDADKKRSCGELADNKSSEGSMYIVVVRTWTWLARRGEGVVANRKQRTIV